MSGAQIARVPLTATEIYDQLHGGPGSDRLSAAQQAAASLRDLLDDCFHEVNALTGQMREGWQGEAGAAAEGAAKPLAVASDHDSGLLDKADGAIGDQITAFHTARNSVVPVPPDPPEMTSQGLSDSFVSGFSGYARDLVEYRTNGQTNIDAFAAYNVASTTNGQTVPSSYTTLSAPNSAITMTDGAAAKDNGTATGTGPSSTVGGPVGASGGAPVSGPGGSARTYGAPPPAGTPGNTGSPPAASTNNTGNAGSAGNDPGGTSASSYRPQPTPQSPQQGGYQFGPNGRPISNLNTPGANGSGTGIVPTGGPGGSGSAAGIGGSRPGGIGSGAGVGRGGGIPGGGASGQGPGAAAPGRGSGAVPPGQAPASGARGVPGASGTSASGGRGGAMPMGAGGGGRGKGGEDEEHQRAEYVKNANPEETFGAGDLRTTPPVIGEKRDK